MSVPNLSLCPGNIFLGIVGFRNCTNISTTFRHQPSSEVPSHQRLTISIGCLFSSSFSFSSISSHLHLTRFVVTERRVISSSYDDDSTSCCSFTTIEVVVVLILSGIPQPPYTFRSLAWLGSHDAPNCLYKLHSFSLLFVVLDAICNHE